MFKLLIFLDISLSLDTGFGFLSFEFVWDLGFLILYFAILMGLLLPCSRDCNAESAKDPKLPP
ncbi:MAG: hypothetical protein CEN92_150 [Candidatus Berkelbacteria bacterium Licking1014_96]|uniref:Uncharacterized protein n=1 Tax=Candidatus Berkelbacteria bacterium Licking1014_96 TaxID=2017149 RepID=A0A554LGS9_9BACT|nr:MAG: hypothetical protein CEN92_150 [Candidatus Berkelbacteria bacterium Licking1014_96]